jgi:hypothetical protein
MSDTNTEVQEVTPAAAFDQVIQAKRAEREGAPPIETPPPDPVAITPTPETPADAGVSASTAQETEEVDLAALPPSGRAKLEKYDADLKAREAEIAKERSEKLAALGRLGPTQRRLAELERKSQAAPTQPAAAPAAPSPDSYYDSDEWKGYERDFPVEAAIQRKRDEVAQQRIAKAEAKLAEVDQAIQSRLAVVDQIVGQQDTQNEYAVLEAAHPNWRDLTTPADVSPDKVAKVQWQPGQTGLPIAPDTLQADAIAIPTAEGEIVLKRDYYNWLASQDEDIQRWQFSTSGAKNARLLDLYVRDSALADLHEAQQQAAPVIDPNAAQALKAQQRREQARAAAVTPDLRGGSQPVARVDVARLPEADQFDHAMRQIREKRRQQQS